MMYPPRSFLELVCRELLGGPAYGRSWHCPHCDPRQESEWASFSVRPPKRKRNGEEYPIKFKCHRCQRWGDEHDLLRLL
jgi:hypothetical protein